jgi:hypothetical protein
MALEATRGEGSPGEGNWTEYMKAFNGRLYRPDVAQSDAEGGEADSRDGQREPIPIKTERPAPVAQPIAANPQASAMKQDAPGAKLAITNPLFETSSQRKR